ANSTASGNQAFSFIGSSAFSAAGQVRFDTTTPGVTGIFADINGDKIADLHIQIDTSVTLNAASFVL
ncbi:protease, partial [Sphingomonas oleivorans]